MCEMKQLVLIAIFISCSFGQNNENLKCSNMVNCGTCIQELGCSWCAGINSMTSKCLPNTNNNCSGNLENPQSSHTVVKQDPLNGTSIIPIQLRPQNFTLKLRKGEPYTIHFEYAQAQNYPVDLYYVMDLSQTMAVHKNKLAQLAFTLAESMKSLTNNFRLGFGSFVDKVELPFASTHPEKLKQPCGKTKCAPAYSFINHMSLGTDFQRFSDEVKAINASGNIDAPEGGFDAIMQAIVCKTEIGWRENARHLIVFSTDSIFHLAGDGKLLGVIEPNDAKCHIKNNTYTDSLQYDYPSISQLNYIAKENDINLVFAIVKVDNNAYDSVYSGLSKKIENSNVGFLDDTSDNVISLITENYKKITDKVTMTTNSLKEIKVKFSSNCTNPMENGCTNVHVGEMLHFNATITALECNSSSSNTYTIDIKPGALNERIRVDIEVICNCDCAKNKRVNSSTCNNRGDLECGTCRCSPGYMGPECECNENSYNPTNLTECRKSNDSDEICSNNGDCNCGTCNCNFIQNTQHKLTGKFCDCNNFNCPELNGQMCSGHGECVCGLCKCHADWSGNVCDCTSSTTSCMPPESSEICSGHGECECGKCKCNSGNTIIYSGEWCQESPAQRCAELKDCVECQVYGTGLFNKETCQTNCTSFNTTTVKTLSAKMGNSEFQCKFPDKQDCNIIFTYTKDQKIFIVKALENKECPEPINPLPWIVGVVGTIVFIGLLTLIMWKICTTIHDKREYARFEKEKQNLKWHRNDNPLFKKASTTFNNPAFNKK